MYRGNNIIGLHRVGGPTPTTTTTTTTTTSTSTTTTTTTPPASKDVNMSIFSYNGGDYSSYSCRCTYVTGSTPTMSVGECYNLTLQNNQYLDPNLSGSSSYSRLNISCNASMLYSCCLCSSDPTPVHCSVCSYTLPQPIDSNDCVVIHAEACSTNISYDACSRTCLQTVSPINGNFQIGTVCCDVNTIAGGTTTTTTTTAGPTTTTTTAGPTTTTTTTLAPAHEWFLPSFDELQWMNYHLHTQLGNDGYPQGDFFYWSSSEVDAHNVHVQYARSGYLTYNGKDVSFHRRTMAVRSFVSATIYNAKDVGPKGGFIFYTGTVRQPAGGGTYTYYETYPLPPIGTSDLWVNISLKNTLIGTSTAIGTGKANTLAIITAGAGVGAAKLAYDLTL